MTLAEMNSFRFVPDARVWSVAHLLDYNQLKRDGTEVHIEGLPLSSSQHDLHESLLDLALTEHVVSLQLSAPTPPLTTKAESMKRLLLRCPSLKTLGYEDIGRGTSFEFQPGERMPPVQSLSLRSYDWIHSATEVERHWDLSSLRSLSLTSVPVSTFLLSIPLDDLSQLRCLRVHDSLPHGQDGGEDATRGVYLLVRDHIERLQVLDVFCHTELFGIDAILRHGSSLRELRFRDHVGFQHDDIKCPTLHPQDVAVLGASLSHVRILELDMDVRLCHASEFLQAVSLFPSLHTLALHVQTLVCPDEEHIAVRDADYEAAMETFLFLLRQRETASARVLWKRITINVGGWQRVTTRRLSLAWKRQNARGIFAERCFEMSREEDGQYFVREERCRDASEFSSPSQASPPRVIRARDDCG